MKGAGRTTKSVGAALVCAPLLLFASSARADGTAGSTRRIWASVRPKACADLLPAFVSNIELACDAMGHACASAASEDTATERALLFCDTKGPWTVGLTPILEGEGLVVSLTGDREERLRRAAMWIARASLATNEAPAKDASEAERAREPMSVEYPGLPFALPAPPRPVKPPRQPARAGASLTTFTATTFGGSAFGMNGQISIPLWHSFYWGPLLTYETFTDNEGGALPPLTPGATVLGHGASGGLTLGWGAPFDDQWFGFSFSGGGGETWGTTEWTTGPSGPPMQFGQYCDFTACYARAPTSHTAQVSKPTGLFRSAFSVQLRVKSWAVRPLISSATTFMSIFGTTSVQQSLEIGLAWQAL